MKYARHITKGTSQSQWPEFAVKIISTTKIQVDPLFITRFVPVMYPGQSFIEPCTVPFPCGWIRTPCTGLQLRFDLVCRVACLKHASQELNYEKSVTNEIACLRMFSHPGIARLVSAFRWRDGAYLVLEYASRGDLHTHVKEHGSLSEASTRLVIHVCARVYVVGNRNDSCNEQLQYSGHNRDLTVCASSPNRTTHPYRRHGIAAQVCHWRGCGGLVQHPQRRICVW